MSDRSSPLQPSRRTVLGAMAALTASFAIGTPSARAASGSAYVMGYFTESPNGLGSDYGLHLAVSADSLQWTPLNQNNPVVTPTGGTGGLRDPFILRKQDGTFVVLATDLKGTDWSLQSQYIHVWDSTDLRSFTGYHAAEAARHGHPQLGAGGVLGRRARAVRDHLLGRRLQRPQRHHGELHHRLRDGVGGSGLLRPRL